jgi:hypothetical protein
MAARESYVSERRGLAELTARAQSCVSLWENGFAFADVTGTDLLGRRELALIGRSLALLGTHGRAYTVAYMTQARTNASIFEQHGRAFVDDVRNGT